LFDTRKGRAARFVISGKAEAQSARLRNGNSAESQRVPRGRVARGKSARLSRQSCEPERAMKKADARGRRLFESAVCSSLGLARPRHAYF